MAPVRNKSGIMSFFHYLPRGSRWMPSARSGRISTAVEYPEVAERKFVPCGFQIGMHEPRERWL